jgi:hypothetical protein
LTPVEQSLVEHVGCGKWLDLAAEGEAVDEAAMRSWGDSRTCSADVIRDILLGRLAADPDPHGLRLRGARIAGRLDLENLSTGVNFELRDCLLEEGIFAPDAHLATVGLTGCRLKHPTEPPLDADRLTCSTLILIKATVIGHAEVGAVLLRGARIGLLHCGGASLCNDSGPALRGDGLQVGRGMYLRRQFTATGTGQLGAVRLLGAHIGGSFECAGASLRNDSGPALHADSLQVDLGMYLHEFIATGSGDLGAVRLSGSHIGGSLECDGAQLRNKSGPVLYADRLQVGQSMFLRYGFTATGSSGYGTVYLVGSHIGGQLNCTRAELRNDSGPALSAGTLQVGQDMFLSGFTGTGVGEDGAVRLTGAHIGGSLLCDGVSLRNDSGPALVGYGLQVGQSVFLSRDRRFTAIGAGERGAVRLIGAHIGGNLDCTGSALDNESGPALIAYGLQVGQSMYLSDGFTATGGGADVAVDLTGARVGGTLVFDPARLEHSTDPRRRLAVDGLTYTGVPQHMSAGAWLALLRKGAPRYAAQPYQQLAAGYRALGDERHVRQTLMAQRDDQLARADTSWPGRWWGKITKVTLGYGYQPWRALWFLAGVVAVSCLLAWLLGAHGALAQTSNTAAPGRSCTLVQQVSVGLDLSLPVGTSMARMGCDLTADSASVTAAWLTTVGWVLRVLAWGFAALFIAGFTSAVRKT